MSRYRVLVIDDSALMRKVLREILSQDPQLEVVGAAADAVAGMAAIEKLNPDVVTLDVEMPKLNGLDFLAQLMRTRPLPVVMVSTLTEAGASTALRALELGAVDVVGKPRMDIEQGVLDISGMIAAKVKAAAAARVSRLPSARSKEGAEPGAPAASALARLQSRTAARGPAPHAPQAARGADGRPSKLIAIGASTGGTEALRVVLTAMPADSPPIVVVQHMPEHFTKQFADRLASKAAIKIREARDGERLLPGTALIAPGGKCHMKVINNAAGLSVAIVPGDPVNHHRPAVDVLFRSCVDAVGARVSAALLTGMGADGARGLLELRRAGARTIAEHEDTCVVYGMPKEAIAMGAAEHVTRLPDIAAQLYELSTGARAA